MLASATPRGAKGDVVPARAKRVRRRPGPGWWTAAAMW